MVQVREPEVATLLLTLRGDARAPALARAELDAYAAELLPPDRLADARLLVTELVTNGVLHGDGDVRLRVEASSEKVHVEVVDDGDGFRAVRRVPDRDRDRNGGWGLGIVEALADRWGVFAGSTHVWFEIDRSLSG